MTRSNKDFEKTRQNFKSLISRASAQPPSGNPSRNPSINPSRNPSRNSSRNPSKSPPRNPFRNSSPERKKIRIMTKEEIESINQKLDTLIMGQKRLEDRIVKLEEAAFGGSFNPKDKAFVNVIIF
jgi:hypothetical protein